MLLEYGANSYLTKYEGGLFCITQSYIMFPAPIAFLDDDLKAELGMKSKKEEEEDDAKFCSFKVPMDHVDKDSKTYVIKIKKYQELWNNS
jgi:hypothetical protein